MDTEKNYTKEMEKLHQKQFESLPEEKQYKGGRTVDELLQDMAEGKTLDDAETEYVKIFANLKDFEKAQQKAELKNDFSEDFVKDALINIIGHNRISGDLGIPDFTSEFQFSNGAFSVADSGFTVDMAALDRRLTPQPHDNMYSDMYEYSFRKVL